MVERMIRRAVLIVVVAAGGLAADDAERFRFLPTDPTWLTASIDLRDPSEALWPSLIGGRNAGGELRLDHEGMSGAFIVRCDQHSQYEGDQSRRVLGDQVVAKPMVELTISAIRDGAAKLTAEAELARATGDAATRPEPPKQVVLVGTLALLGHSLPVEIPAAVVRVGEKLTLSGTWQVDGAAIGLALKVVTIDFSVAGYRNPDDLKAGTGGPSLDLELSP